MLSVARYLIQVQYFSWQLVNIISRDFFFLSTQRTGKKKTNFTIKTNLNIKVNSLFNIYSQPFLKEETTCKSECPFS